MFWFSFFLFFEAGFLWVVLADLEPGDHEIHRSMHHHYLALFLFFTWEVFQGMCFICIWVQVRDEDITCVPK